MSRPRRATLRAVWWRQQMALIRFCHACGGRLERRYIRLESRRRHICVECETIAYVNPKVVAGLIPVLPDGRVVLLRRDIEPGKGKWSYPAGYQEMAETVEAAAARETWEEICVKVHAPRYLGIYSYPDAGVVTIVYAAEVKRGETPAPGIESQEIGIFTPDEIPWSRLAFRSTTHALKDWVASRRKKRSNKGPRATTRKRRDKRR